MTTEEKIQLWKKCASDDLLREMQSLSPEELKERFESDLTFGTAGLRGKMGVGTNRLNVYTVRKYTLALAHLAAAHNATGIAVCYDTRLHSKTFAEETAKVLTAAGLKVFLAGEPMPTPVLSFAVRHLRCYAGVMITASHNPKEYNGYKVYQADGGQITEAIADDVQDIASRLDAFDIPTLSLEEAAKQNLVHYFDQCFLDAYFANVEAQEFRRLQNVKIVYTPLNGTGARFVPQALKQQGVRYLHVVKEQSAPDGTFPTCPKPNPETEEALALGVQALQELHYDVLLATDPDCDRVGVVVMTERGPVHLSGNDVGVLLLNYILTSLQEQKMLPPNPLVVKTIVSSDLATRIAQKYGAHVKNVLTGFKYIGEAIGKAERLGGIEQFIFGFEESCGYLSGTYVRDKDAVNACTLIAEMTEYYLSQGKTLLNVLGDLFLEFGYYQSKQLSFQFEGTSGKRSMAKFMDEMRYGEYPTLCGQPVLCRVDYLSDDTHLPKENMLLFELPQGRVILRPSGTEPKLKIYLAYGYKNMREISILDELSAFFTQAVQKSSTNSEGTAQN